MDQFYGSITFSADFEEFLKHFFAKFFEKYEFLGNNFALQSHFLQETPKKRPLLFASDTQPLKGLCITSF